MTTATQTQTSLLATARPRHDRIVVRMEEAARQTPGGIFLPDASIDQQKPVKGVVIAIGPGRREDRRGRLSLVDAMRGIDDLKVGDHVLCVPYAGMKLDPKDPHVIIRDEDVIAAYDPPSDGDEEPTP